MKNLLRITSASILLSIILISCIQNEPKINTVSEANQILENNFTAIADTIITDVVIKNPDQDEWIEYALRNLEKKQLINELFDLVYSSELIPYNFFLDTPMTIDEVKEIEKEEKFLREKIGKVQFEEAWYLDAKNQKMMKQVHSIMLAYELYDANGEIKGYKPIFKVYFNKQ